jgi:hypothetical protein
MGVSPGGYEYSFKILLIGDSGVGKSSFVAAANLEDDIAPTIGTSSYFLPPPRHATSSPIALSLYLLAIPSVHLYKMF